MTELEICVESAACLHLAQAARVDRVELCSALALGGLTPSAGLMAQARHSPVPVYAMIRPRGGDFVFSAEDEQTMREDILAARQAGLAGVVLGAARPDGTLDEAMLGRLSEACGPMGRTLHRVFDLTPDLAQALEVAVRLGFERVLTSGGAATAEAGLSVIAALGQQAAGRIAIMAGSGLSTTNLPRILQLGRPDAVHGSCRASSAAVPDIHLSASRGLDFGATPVPTDAGVIRAFQSMIRAQRH